MAAARWVGRGDKNGADGAAVNAMRLLINTVSMNGVVVIGEGEKDRAPMLFNGEQVGDGTGPAVRRGGGPDRRHPAGRQRHAGRDLGAGRQRPRSHVRPVGRFLHVQARHRPGGGRRCRHRGPGGANVAAVARAKGCSPHDVTVDHPGPAPACEPDRRRARDRRADQADHRRRRGRRDPGCPRGTGIDLLLGIGGTPEGVIAACAIKCLGGIIQGKLAPRDDAERAAPWTPATTWTGC